MAASVGGPPINNVLVTTHEESILPPENPILSEPRESRSIKKRLSLSRATKGLKRIIRSSHSSARPVLEYYDVCLRQEDIDNLKPNHWLQDSNIEFFYEWMEREKMPQTEPRLIFLLRPSIGYLCASIAQQGGVVDDSLLPTGILDAEYIFIPVTDNVDPTKAGGSHWSLLLLGVDERKAWYIDSLPPSGADKMSDCRSYAKAMNQVFDCEFDLISSPAPKQANGSDCGIHVCMETDLLLARIRNLPPDHRHFDASLAGQTFDAAAYRVSLQTLITNMITERGHRVGRTEDIAVSPERRSSSRTRPSIDQRLRPAIPEETIME